MVKPQNQYTTDGIAANKSIKALTKKEMDDFIYSLRNSEVAIHKGEARITANNEVVNVPKIKGSAPKIFLFGIQSLLIIKEKP